MKFSKPGNKSVNSTIYLRSHAERGNEKDLVGIFVANCELQKQRQHTGKPIQPIPMNLPTGKKSHQWKLTQHTVD